MRKARILIAHPQLERQRRLTFVAEQAASCAVRCLVNGYEALEAAQSWLPDLLILDLNLVGLDGLQVCYRLRAIPQFRETPIFVSLPPEAKSMRYRAYQVGADDLIDFPCDEMELSYRLRVHLRRCRLLPDPVVSSDGLFLDPNSQTATMDGKSWELTPSEYAILSLLVARSDQALSTETLLTEALGAPPQLGNPQVVHTHIRNLRRKLEPDPAHPQHLCFIRRGYQWFSSPS